MNGYAMACFLKDLHALDQIKGCVALKTAAGWGVVTSQAEQLIGHNFQSADAAWQGLLHLLHSKEPDGQCGPLSLDLLRGLLEIALQRRSPEDVVQMYLDNQSYHYVMPVVFLSHLNLDFDKQPQKTC